MNLFEEIYNDTGDAEAPGIATLLTNQVQHCGLHLHAHRCTPYCG